MGATCTLPASLMEGETVSWTVEHPDYHASSGGYAASCVFYTDKQRVTVAGVASGAQFSFTLTAAVSATMYPGTWAWQVVYSRTVDAVLQKHLVSSGTATVLANLANDQIPTVDPRSHAVRMLEKLNAQLSDVAFLRSLSPEQIEGLERVRRQYEWDVKRQSDAEKLRAGGNPTSNIYVRFAP